MQLLASFSDLYGGLNGKVLQINHHGTCKHALHVFQKRPPMQKLLPRANGRCKNGPVSAAATPRWSDESESSSAATFSQPAGAAENSTQLLFSKEASSTQSPPAMISPADDPPATSEPAEPIVNRHTHLLFSEPASPPSPLTHIREAGETGTSPNAQPSVRRTQNFRWGDLSGNEFVIQIQTAYAEVVHWRQNLFKIPRGRSGKEFTAEMARLLAAFAEASALEDIAVKAAMTLPGLLLQKPSAQSKAKEHAEVLERRMQQWKEGEIQALLQEGRVLQQRLQFTHSRSRSQGQDRIEERLAEKFAEQVHHGRTKAALRTLSQAATGQRTCILQAHESADKTQPAKETVLDILKAKHPPGAAALPETLVDDDEVDPPEFHPVIFNNITAEAVREAAIRCNGSAGPSGLDAAAWQRMCTAFKGRSNDICTAIARLARRICTEEVSAESLCTFTACRLIALDKKPGVRQIGAGEVLRRIVGKATLKVVKARHPKGSRNHPTLCRAGGRM